MTGPAGDVELLYLDGCPNWTATAQRVREALRALGQDGSALRLRRVESAEQAEREGFRGSPTVLVDGHDPFADGAAAGGLTCRVFATPDGLSGAPTVDQLVQALRRTPGDEASAG